MSGLNNDWFYDDVENISIGLKVDNVVFDTQTRFQHAIVFKNKAMCALSECRPFLVITDITESAERPLAYLARGPKVQRFVVTPTVLHNGQFGRVLVLDGTVQLTEKDEFAYHEMIAHLPLNLHSDPKKVLIIGGGDGGVAREVVKKPKVQSVDLVEIDQEILDLSRKYLPFTSCGLDHPKVTIHVQDGAEFIKNVRGKYDVIITDSSDLEGENISVALFQQNYYESVKRALAPGGILCSQAMGMWVDEEMTKVIHSACTAVFKSVAVATVSVPSYLGGGNAFILCSDTPNKNFIQPTVELTEWEMEEMNLRYYTPSVHRSAFILPRRFQKIFQNSLPKQHKSTSVDHGSK